MNYSEENSTNIDNELEKGLECYLNTRKINGEKTREKGVLNLIKEDAFLSKKITYEEAILMNPSILDDVPNKEEVLKELRKKYDDEDSKDIDSGLEEALDTYLETVTKTNGASRILSKNK